MFVYAGVRAELETKAGGMGHVAYVVESRQICRYHHAART